ncbi:Cytochrome c-type biogenesis protein DsbD, protein-disulfide reductase [hydrothermal vent metagenome]|uniref:Thiol:disulfide interchange protein DsbD n=1 Tax=hydrothermal vent metagenome TaxID=652676 RepID=A0A3B0VFF0_9ZZZZ
MNKITLYILLTSLIFASLFSTRLLALEPDELLDVDIAFVAEIVEVNTEDIKLRFKVADEYYLYKHAFSFANKDNVVKFGTAQIPDGEKKVDEFFGEVETYRHQVDIVIPYENIAGVASTKFEFTYQGCADAGICYPPQTKILTLNLPVPQDSVLHAANPLVGNTAIKGGLGLTNSDEWSGQLDTVLPEDKAFLFETIAMDANTLSARFSISDNVYLYKDQVKLTSLTKGIDIGALHFPASVIKDDPHFGEVEVFFGVIEVGVDISREAGSTNTLILQAEFLGCIDEGICYPPSIRTISVDLPAITTAISANKQTDKTKIDKTMQLSEQDQIQVDLEVNAWWKTILKFFGFGLLLALTPCVFPMIPILSGLIMGQGNISRRRAFTLSLIYVLAMAMAYTIAGVIAGLLGANIQAALQKPWIIITFSMVFVALAMSMFGYYELQLPSSWQNKLSKLSNKQKSGSYIGVGIMGFVSAIIVGPCVAPPLAGAVLYISNTGDPIVGGFALFAMSMGMGVPLLLIGASAGKWMPSSGGWMNVVKAFFGIALLAMAIWFLARIIPGPVSLAMYGILALLSSIFWYRYALKNGVKGKMTILFLVFKIILISIGTVQIIGAIKGNSDPLNPLTVRQKMQFQMVKSYAEVQQVIQQSDKLVLLDFYADWCIECTRMEESTYAQASVQKELENFLVLKADVTAQDAVDKELMRKFKIIGPPATLFFGTDNQLIKHSSFFGFKGPDEFIEHLRQIK